MSAKMTQQWKQKTAIIQLFKISLRIEAVAFSTSPKEQGGFFKKKGWILDNRLMTGKSKVRFLGVG